MPLLNINLLERQQTALDRYNRATVVVAAVAGGLIGLQLLAAVFLFSTKAIRQNEKTSLENKTSQLQQKIAQLDKVTNTAYPKLTLTQQAVTYQEQLDSVKKLVDNHKYFSLYLAEIAINTPDPITYESFAVDSSSQLTVIGFAETYPDVSKLAANFSNLSFAKSTSISEAKSIKDSRTGRVTIKFSLAIKLKSAEELNKLPKPGKLSVTPTPRAKVTPSTKPSASPR